jgi:hypothetical protein
MPGRSPDLGPGQAPAAGGKSTWPGGGSSPAGHVRIDDLGAFIQGTLWKNSGEKWKTPLPCREAWG